jgi:hypothetical protein
MTVAANEKARLRRAGLDASVIGATADHSFF